VLSNACFFKRIDYVDAFTTEAIHGYVEFLAALAKVLCKY
jgi:hypothetical protein